MSPDSQGTGQAGGASAPPPAGQPVSTAVPSQGEAQATPPAGAPVPNLPPPLDALPTDAEGNRVLATPDGQGDGVNRCPKCGASDTKWVTSKSVFMCAFCRNEWAPMRLDEAMGLSEGIGALKGTVVSTAATDITDDNVLITLHCTGCGADVVVDTSKNLHARCHWCKHVLSLNNKVPNGAVPDGILPFAISQDQAMAAIKAFVAARKSFALPAFAESFRPENVMGVYLPYMTVDGNLAVRLDGQGEVLLQRWTDSNKRTHYKFDRYNVMRQVSLEVDDLIVETSKDKVNIKSVTSTTNIINAVLPFDVKNIVRFNSNFLGDSYTSERRDMDVDEAESYAANHFLTIARGAVAASLRPYNRGVRWDSEQAHVRGSRWTSVLLPVWLYGFVENRGGKAITHYLAVNGRTGATMGSVPINRAKALAVAWGVGGVISLVTWPIALGILLAS